MCDLNIMNNFLVKFCEEKLEQGKDIKMANMFLETLRKKYEQAQNTGKLEDLARDIESLAKNYKITADLQEMPKIIDFVTKLLKIATTKGSAANQDSIHLAKPASHSKCS